MLIVETIAKIRRLFRNEHKSIREISRELRLSRKVVRKALRSDKTAFGDVPFDVEEWEAALPALSQ